MVPWPRARPRVTRCPREEETLALAGTLDDIRAQIGLVFPGE